MLREELSNKELEFENELNKANDAKKFYENKCRNNLKDSIINNKSNSIV